MFDIFGEMDMTIEKFFEDIAEIEQSLEDYENQLEEIRHYGETNYNRYTK